VGAACGGLQRITTRPSLKHPRVIAVVAACTFLVSAVVASRDTPPRWELDITEWINSAPQWVADALYPIMQLGTLLGPLLVAAFILLYRRDWLLAVATIAVGVVAWFGAKGIKRLIERGRPLEFLPNIDVREGEGTGLGFVSGHSTVAAASAVMLMAALPPRWRPLAGVTAALVGVARIVFGLHLPADVVGGWSFGVLLALGAHWIVEVVERARGPVAR
jgi:undecaprenyl-diphosphatase